MRQRRIANLPVGDEIFLDHVGHFVRDAGRRQPRARARGLCADAGIDPVQSRRHRRWAPATSPRCSRAAISRCCSRPPTRRLAASSRRRWPAMPACTSPISRSSMPKAHHRRLTDAGFAMRPLVQFQRPVGTESRAGHRRLHRGPARARRHAGGPHPDSDSPHRGHGLAEALAEPSQWRAGAGRRGGRQSPMSRRPRHASRASPSDRRSRRKFGQAIVLDRGQVQLARARSIQGDASRNPGAAPAVHRRLCDPGAVAGDGRSPAAASRACRCAGSARRWSCRSPTSSASAHGCSSRMPPICPGEAEKSPLWKGQGDEH